MKNKYKYIIGIDEVGRGPLAGPLVVAAVALPLKLKIKTQKSKSQSKNKKFRVPLRDSKKLSVKQREEWFKYIKNHSQVFYAAAFVSHKTIDKINVSNAANLAATKSFRKLTINYGLRTTNCKILLDGGLYLKNLKPSAGGGSAKGGKTLKLKPKTIVEGDEKIPAIALASIVAKVTRDRQMLQLHKKYPKYGFDKHKGYGTKKHIKAIKKHGLSPIHRKSFRIFRIKQH